MAEVAGRYRLTVRPTQKDAPIASYTIWVGELLAATENERAWRETRKLHNEFDRLLNAGRYDEAQRMIERILEIRERILGAGTQASRPRHSAPGRNLAFLYSDQGEYAKAEPLYRRALAISEKSHGPEHPDVAFTLNALARLYCNQGDHAKAGPMWHRALAIQEKTQGPDHSEVAEVLGNLATFYAIQKDIAQTVTFQSRANTISERNLALNLAIGSERQKLAYLALFSKETDLTLSLHSLVAPNDQRALDLALTTLLRRKGRGLDAMTDTIAVLGRRSAPEDQKLFDQLAEARSQLAAFTLKESSLSNNDTYRAQLKPLEEKVEQIEAELSSRSAEFRAQTEPVTLAAVQSALPASSALIEFAVYTPRELRTDKAQPPRYVAYLLAAQGPPKWGDLGEASII